MQNGGGAGRRIRQTPTSSCLHGRLPPNLFRPDPVPPQFQQKGGMQDFLGGFNLLKATFKEAFLLSTHRILKWISTNLTVSQNWPSLISFVHTLRASKAFPPPAGEKRTFRSATLQTRSDYRKHLQFTLEALKGGHCPPVVNPGTWWPWRESLPFHCIKFTIL